MGHTAPLFLGMPLSHGDIDEVLPVRPFTTEVYPTEMGGTGQDFYYNDGRAIGACFAKIIGYAAQVVPLVTAIALFGSLASRLIVVTALLLPGNARPRRLATSTGGSR